MTTVTTTWAVTRATSVTLAALPDVGPVGEYTAAGWYHHSALAV